MKTWKSYKEKYEVSNEGDVRNSETGLVLKNNTDKYGYHTVTLWLDKVPKTLKVHRLVATCFIENPDNKEQVNHKDGNKKNNFVNNLEWSTPIENIRHACDMDLLPKGSSHYEAVLTEEDVQEIRYLLSEGYGNSFIGNKFGVTCGAIYAIRVNKSWQHLPWPFPYRLFEATKETKLVGSQRKEAKLDEKRIREIKRLLSDGVSIAVLQKKFNISGGALRCIRAGTTWKHVTI
jgi:hypothetical protein